MKKIMIIGATSAIALASARLFARDGDALFLVARDADKLRTVSEDMETRGAGLVESCVMDALEYDRHASIIQEAAGKLGGLDIALIAHGTLPDQRACEHSFELARKELEINGMSTVSMLTYLGNYFEKKQSGTIAVISSVSGDRGRQSNYVYGAAKGMVSTFLQGLRNRLYKSGVHVLTIKPGFVDTPMTAGFKKGMLWASPDTLASGIYRAISSKRNEIYLPWFWAGIMFVIRSIPEAFFKRLGL